MATAVALPLLMGGCSKTEEGAGSTGTTAPSAAPVNQGITIDIVDYKFEPQDAKAKVGQIVTWRNKQGVKHTVTEDVADDQRKIKSPESIPQDGTYQLTFDTPGTHKYICSIHPTQMKGTITVAS